MTRASPSCKRQSAAGAIRSGPAHSRPSTAAWCPNSLPAPTRSTSYPSSRGPCSQKPAARLPAPRWRRLHPRARLARAHLLVGSAFARSLAWSLGAAHVPRAPHAGPCRGPLDGRCGAQPHVSPCWPLTVSGGHTQLLGRAHRPRTCASSGTTMDDAAGEAFDKVAKMLGLPLPGRPRSWTGWPRHWATPRPSAFTAPKVAGHMTSASVGSRLRYCASSEKTLATGVRKPSDDHLIRDVSAHRPRATIVSILVSKLEAAALAAGPVKAIAIQGGVSANSGLRQAVLDLGSQHGWTVHVPPFRYCTDNGAMIALSGQYAAERNGEGALDEAPLARWPMQ